jgi:hypothetical protein
MRRECSGVTRSTASHPSVQLTIRGVADEATPIEHILPPHCGPVSHQPDPEVPPRASPKTLVICGRPKAAGANATWLSCPSPPGPSHVRDAHGFDQCRAPEPTRYFADRRLELEQAGVRARRAHLQEALARHQALGFRECPPPMPCQRRPSAVSCPRLPRGRYLWHDDSRCLPRRRFHRPSRNA